MPNDIMVYYLTIQPRLPTLEMEKLFSFTDEESLI